MKKNDDDDSNGSVPPARAPLVVLVEDNENDELLARAALRATGIAVELLVARDGEEALDVLLGRGSRAAETGRRQPDLVLLDLNLPKLDGHEVLRRLQQDARARRLPVVVLSSSSEERDLVRAYQLGARSYVCKPIEFEEFVGALRATLSYWLTINVPPPAP